MSSPLAPNKGPLSWYFRPLVSVQRGGSVVSSELTQNCGPELRDTALRACLIPSRQSKELR